MSLHFSVSKPYLPALSLALLLGGCSSDGTAPNGSGAGASASTGGASGEPDPGMGGDETDAATGGAGQTETGGTSATGGDGSGGAAPSTGGGPTETDGGLVETSRGCGQGTKCTDGDDLPAPAAADGVQFVFKDQVTIKPGEERFLCFYKTLPGTAELQVGAFQSWMTTGSSHHFIAYHASKGEADGTLKDCAFGNGAWMYATSVSGKVIELAMPEKVGLPLAGGTSVIMNMHFINTSTEPVSPTLKLNLLYAKDVQYKAAAMTSFNLGINVPANGTQTVNGSCKAPAGAKFFAMTTHTHKHATAADVRYVSGGLSQHLVHTVDWESPDMALFTAPDFLTMKAGDTFQYSCTYRNDSATAVKVGETAATNEMCMAIGYYFPAGTTSCN